ncbi:MAG: hypothetical protein ABJB12_02905 [Pseudomonadota bacterium]
MNQLVPCPECGRHVRVSETECPFCALPLDLAGTPEARLPGTRLSRAATLAFGATLASATALAACSGESAPVPFYGAPGVSGSAGASSAGAAGTAQGGNGGGPVPFYGAPAGGDISIAGAGTDAAGKGGGGPVPVYGAAP